LTNFDIDSSKSWPGRIFGGLASYLIVIW
jgi:hypothetical protein